MNGNYNEFQNGPQNEAPHCPRCGAPLANGATFCGNCGLQLTKQASGTDVLSVGDYILMMVLFQLPVIGLVLMLYWISYLLLRKKY